MCNDSTYFLALALVIVGAFSFVIGRFYERADRWLKDWDASRRAAKAAVAARDARLSISRVKIPSRDRVQALGRELARIASRSSPTVAREVEALR